MRYRGGMSAKGWQLFETVGIAVVNPRGLSKLSIESDRFVLRAVLREGPSGSLGVEAGISRSRPDSADVWLVISDPPGRGGSEPLQVGIGSYVLAPAPLLAAGRATLRPASGVLILRDTSGPEEPEELREARSSPGWAAFFDSLDEALAASAVMMT